MAIAILKAKRAFLVQRIPLQGTALDRANTAAYNCGEGNVVKVVKDGKDIDDRTAHKNYSADVWRLRELYKSLV